MQITSGRVAAAINVPFLCFSGSDVYARHGSQGRSSSFSSAAPVRDGNAS